MQVVLCTTPGNIIYIDDDVNALVHYTVALIKVSPFLSSNSHRTCDKSTHLLKVKRELQLTKIYRWQVNMKICIGH